MGVTVRELHGWSPRTVTLDADGNVQSVTASESRFTPRELAVLLASRRLEKTQVGRHGLPMTVATDAKNRDKFEVPNPIADWAQKKLNAVQKAYAEKYPDADMDAMRWTVKLID